MGNNLANGYDDLVSLIYDGVLCPEAWKTWLDQLVAASGARSGLLFLHHQETLAMSAHVESGFRDEFALYNREHYQHNIWKLNAMRMPLEVMYSSQALCSQRELHKTGFYTDFCRITEVEHLAGGVFSTDGPWQILLALHRTPAQGEFNEAEMALLNRFVPHLRRALHLSRVMDQGKGNLEGAVDRLPLPCVLLDRQQTIIAMNDRARQLITRHPGLAIKQDRLVVKSGEIAQRLDALIADSFRTLSTSEGQGGGLVKLPGPDPTPIVISVTPCRRSTHIWHQHDGDTVAVLFYDPAQKRAANGEIVQAMYGLTAAETRVAVLLSQGQSVTEIADALKISVNAVRYHLKAIFGKVGVSRQSELVSHLLSYTTQTGSDFRKDLSDISTCEDLK